MAKTLNKDEMITYMKQAMKLESSVYTQENAIAEADKKLAQSMPKMRSVKRVEVKSPEKPDMSVDKGNNGAAGCFGTLFFLAGLLFIVVAILTKTFLISLCSVGFFVPVGIALKIIIENLTSAKKQKKTNQEKYANYQNAVATLPQRKESAEKQYQAEVKKAETEYAEASKRYKTATLAVNRLQKPLHDTKNTLQHFYSVDILYPKYGNLVAVSTIYEYFASGRVDTLEGPNGAYNLYESELRQNIIIGKLDTIISQLEQIKTNQYALYNELKEMNQVLYEITSDISMLVSATHEIADATKITAFCSQVTAQNTEALKWLAIINT